MAHRIPPHRRSGVERGAVEHGSSADITDTGAQASASSSETQVLYDSEPQHTFNIVHEQRGRRLIPETSSEESDDEVAGSSRGPRLVDTRPSRIPERVSFEPSRMIRRDEPPSSFSRANLAADQPLSDPMGGAPWLGPPPRTTTFVPLAEPAPRRATLGEQETLHQWAQQGQFGHDIRMYSNDPSRFPNVAQQARQRPLFSVPYPVPVPMPPRHLYDPQTMAQPTAPQYPTGPSRYDVDISDAPYYPAPPTAEGDPMPGPSGVRQRSSSIRRHPAVISSDLEATNDTEHAHVSDAPVLQEMHAQVESMPTTSAQGNEGSLEMPSSNDRNNDLPGSHNIQQVDNPADETDNLPEELNVDLPPRRRLHRVAGSRSLSQRSSSTDSSVSRTEDRTLHDRLGGLHVHVHIDNSKYKQANIGREPAELHSHSISSRAPSPAQPTQPLIPRTSSALLRPPITHLEDDPTFPHVEVLPAPEPGRRGRPRQFTVLVTVPPAQIENDNLPEPEQGEASHSPPTSRRSSLREPINEGLQVPAVADIPAPPETLNMGPTAPERHEDLRRPQGILHEDFGVDSDANMPGPSGLRPPVTPERHAVDQSLGRSLNLTEERRVSSETDTLSTSETSNAPPRRHDIDLQLPQQPTTTTSQIPHPPEGIALAGFNRPPELRRMRSFQRNHDTRGRRPSQRQVRGPQVREILFHPDLPGGFVDYTQIKNIYRRTRRRRVLRFLGITHDSENHELAYPIMHAN